MKDDKRETLEPLLREHISPNATALHTDESAVYARMGAGHFPGKHYGMGDLHTNTVENAFSLLKRGIYGAFHGVSIKHLGRYCQEFSYRFNRRDAPAQLFDAVL